ncbi:unnamed protein product [Pleuronectes platessa]|uniref:Uncharacterized protein n=1 Tax=Pleuronectes platessa TaxID=8262 RepID=A0A9N7VEE7_PLEPL|nr:unnamed protein product [Pleuronectes platessa]
MRRAYAGERIQPPRLEIPGERRLSGPGMTCCDSYGLSLCIIDTMVDHVFTQSDHNAFHSETVTERKSLVPRGHHSVCPATAIAAADILSPSPGPRDTIWNQKGRRVAHGKSVQWQVYTSSVHPQIPSVKTGSASGTRLLSGGAESLPRGIGSGQRANPEM